MQKFNYHSHTYRCKHADLDMEDEDYVKEYIKMGFTKIAFTDHCPEKNEIDKRQNMRMKYSEKNDYLRSIKELKEKYKDKIEIETGYEVEYLPGEEENIIELKNETDKIVLGQHFIYDDNKKLKIIFENNDNFKDKDLLRYAEYIEKAMELNIPDIIAHPDIFMIGRENFGNIETKVANIICKSAEKHNIPLEINLAKIFNRTYYNLPENLTYKERMERLATLPYPHREFWKIAANHNVKVLYGIDVHHRGQILKFNELIDFARKIIGEETISKLNFIEDL